MQVRASLLTASQCATYDEAKQLLLARSGLPDSLLLHLMASMATGLVTTTVTNPADVVKTRMFVGEQGGAPGWWRACICAWAVACRARAVLDRNPLHMDMQVGFLLRWGRAWGAMYIYSPCPGSKVT